MYIELHVTNNLLNNKNKNKYTFKHLYILNAGRIELCAVTVDGVYTLVIRLF